MSRTVLGLAALLVVAAGAAGATERPRFVDVTEAAGIDFVHVHGGSGKRYLPETMGAGGAVLDFDGDGRMDLFLVQSGPLPGFQGESGGHALYRNLGDGRFADVSAESGLQARTGYGQGAVAGDVDGDGRVDLYLTQLGQNRLYRNLGGGRFEDITGRAGVGDPAWSSSAVLFDADGDGWLDLYVVNYLQFTPETHRDCSQRSSGLGLYCHPDAYPPARDRYYRNLGGGRFEDATERAGFLSAGKGLGAIALDFDRDGDLDLYVANDSTPNFLYVNDGQGRFEEQGLLLGVAYNEDGRSEAGMGVDAGDVDGDGFEDLIVTNLSLEANALYLGGAQGFRYGTRTAGLFGPSFPVLGFGVALADFDNDADLDLFVVNGDVQDNIAALNDALSYRQPAQLFLNDGRGRFSEAPSAALGDPAVPRVGRALLPIDFDDDGRLDLLVTYSNDRARLYRNQGEAGAWLGVAALACGAPAVGAELEVETANGTLRRALRAGSGYQGSADPRLHIGLGGQRPARVRLRWPDGRIEALAGREREAYAVVKACPRPDGGRK